MGCLIDSDNKDMGHCCDIFLFQIGLLHHPEPKKSPTATASTYLLNSSPEYRTTPNHRTAVSEIRLLCQEKTQFLHGFPFNLFFPVQIQHS